VGAAHAVWLDAPDVVFPALDQFQSGTWPANAAHPPVLAAIEGAGVRD